MNNVANVPATLAREQRRRGHDALVFDLHRHPYGFKNDGQVSLIQRLLLPYQAFDIFHLHSCSMWPFYLDSNLWPLMRGKQIIYHHHGSDVRYRGCCVTGNKKPHLVSTPDLAKWCPNALYVPNPVKNDVWWEENARYTPIQTISRMPQERFFQELESHRNLVDLPWELLGVKSLSAIQAEGMGLHVERKIPHPNEVGHVCDALDYIYRRMM